MHFIKNIKTLGAFFLLGLTASCNLLDQKSPNDIAADDVFTNATGAENALIGLYRTLGARDYYGGHYVLLSDAFAGICETGGYDVASLDEFGSAGERNLTGQNLYLEATYIAIYRTIANANRLLEGLEAIADDEFEDGRKDRIRAEARVIRAMAHFDLLRYFGFHWDLDSENGIPLVKEVLGYSDILPRATVAEVYDFVFTELQDARTSFDETESPLVNYVNRATVDALLARICLYAGDYSRARNYASEVIGRDSVYALLTGEEVSSVYTNYGSSESIFELSFDLRNQSAFNGLTYLKDNPLPEELFFMASSDMEAFFAAHAADPRGAICSFDEDSEIYPLGRTQKYRGEDTRNNPAFLLRLAEMYLIRSEANFRLGDGGLEDLNRLHVARTGEMLAPADDAEFLNFLADEYLAEFNFEGQYLYALSRLGLFTERTGQEQCEAAFPIPDRELSATGGVVTANPCQ